MRNVNTDIIKAMATLGSRLKELREYKSLSQGQVAKYARVSQSTLSDLERGEIAPKTIDAVINLARYFNCSTDYLLGVTDDPTPNSGGEAVPPFGIELLDILRELSPKRAEELHGLARVVAEGNRRDQNETAMAVGLDMVEALGGEAAVDALIEIMRLSRTDPEAALAKMDEFFEQDSHREHNHEGS